MLVSQKRFPLRLGLKQGHRKLLLPKLALLVLSERVLKELVLAVVLDLVVVSLAVVNLTVVNLEILALFPELALPKPVLQQLMYLRTAVPRLVLS